MYEIKKTAIDGCLEILPKIFNDHRGKLVKNYHADTFKKLGIVTNFAEDLVVTSQRGVLRGLHFQKTPFEQAKLIYCAQGNIFDVAVDIRKDSPTFGNFVIFHIDSQKNNMAYIPAGFAHGYQVLENNTIVVYKLSSGYSVEHEGGIRYDSCKIPWPIKDVSLSEKDILLPSFADFCLF